MDKAAARPVAEFKHKDWRYPIVQLGIHSYIDHWSFSKFNRQNIRRSEANSVHATARCSITVPGWRHDPRLHTSTNCIASLLAAMTRQINFGSRAVHSAGKANLICEPS